MIFEAKLNLATYSRKPPTAGDSESDRKHQPSFSTYRRCNTRSSSHSVSARTMSSWRSRQRERSASQGLISFLSRLTSWSACWAAWGLFQNPEVCDRASSSRASDLLAREVKGAPPRDRWPWRCGGGCASCLSCLVLQWGVLGRVLSSFCPGVRAPVFQDAGSGGGRMPLFLASSRHWRQPTLSMFSVVSR